MAKPAQNIPDDDETFPISQKISKTGYVLRDKLARKLGINKTAVVELAIREFAEKHGVTVEATP